MEIRAPPVVLFDGVCNLCAASVQFLLARDRNRTLRFASLQSRAAQSILASLGVTLPRELEAVLLVEDGRVYGGSTAALRTARLLGGAWPLAYILIAVPRPVRDWVYRWVARNRFRWFGRREACWLPSPELRARFLDAGEEPG